MPPRNYCYYVVQSYFLAGAAHDFEIVISLSESTLPSLLRQIPCHRILRKLSREVMDIISDV